MKNAELIDWCAREGWEEEDTGGGCSALIRSPNGLIQRITKADDPSMPQTMSEPIAFGEYTPDDNPLGDARIFQGGVDEWLRHSHAKQS